MNREDAVIRLGPVGVASEQQLGTSLKRFR